MIDQFRMPMMPRTMSMAVWPLVMLCVSGQNIFVPHKLTGLKTFKSVAFQGCDDIDRHLLALKRRTRAILQRRRRGITASRDTLLIQIIQTGP